MDHEEMDMNEAVLEQQQLRPRAIRRVMGKRLRKEVPRSSHGQWAPAADRVDPLTLLQAEDEGRIKELLPIKYGRMSASPFAFLRGAASVMSADLAATPVIGHDVMLCGDAHLANFGLFASPERKLVFDVNDFDQCYPGPWEWDIKRLAASVVVAGRENGFDEATNRDLAATSGEVYRRAMRRLAKMPALAVWYFHIDARDVELLFGDEASGQSRKRARKLIQKTKTKTQARTLAKMTHNEDGRRRFNSQPPLLIPLHDLDLDSELAAEAAKEPIKQLTIEYIGQIWQEYLGSLPPERHYLLERYRITDVALRVGGVGSVGTRCFVVLLEGGNNGEGLILQLKEADPSALAAYLPGPTHVQEAERVVVGQRLIQAVSDPFLGWHQSPLSERAYYWRQLKDMKGSFDVQILDESGFTVYAAICAASLARAHARTGDPALISGYLGKNDTFDRALAEFAVAYADQTEKDYLALKRAIIHGRITAEEGI